MMKPLENYMKLLEFQMLMKLFKNLLPKMKQLNHYKI
jgi:hypothetical protein